MRERRYGVDTRSRGRGRGGGRGRSPSPLRPPPRFREFSTSRHREYSPRYQRGGDNVTDGERWQRKDRSERSDRDFMEAERWQRKDRNERFDRDFIPHARRFSDYDDRDRDRVRDRRGVGDRRLRSPRRTNGASDSYRRSRSPWRPNGDNDRYQIDARRSSRSPWRKEKNDHLDREVEFRSVRLYDDGGKDRDRSGVGVGRSSTFYGEQSHRRDSSPTNFGLDRLLGGPRQSNVSVKGYNHSSDYYRAGDANTTRGVQERDYVPESQYLDKGRAGLSSFSRYLDDSKLTSMEFDRGVRMNADSYAFADGVLGDIPKRNLADGEGSSHKPSVASRYLNSDTDKQGYFSFRDELHLEKRDGVYPEPEQHYVEKKDDDLHLQDDLNLAKLGTERLLGREEYKKEDSFLSSRDYLKGDLDFLGSSSRSKDYVSMSSSSLKESFPGYSPLGGIHVSSHVNQPGTGLSSDPNIRIDGFSGKEDNMFPGGSGVELDVGRSHSRSSLGLPMEKHGDHLCTDYGRRRIEDMSTTTKLVNEGYRNHHVSGIGVLDPLLDESPRQKHMWDSYPSSRRLSTPDKFDSYRSLHVGKQDLDMLGTGSSHNYGGEVYHRHENVTPGKHQTELRDGPWSRNERPDPLESRENDRSFGRRYVSPEKRSPVPHLSSVERADWRRGGRYERDETLFARGVGISISSDGNGARKIYNRADGEDEVDIVKPMFGKSNHERRRTPRKVSNHRPSSSKFVPSHSNNSRGTDSRDIKKRLGPVNNKLHVSQRLMKKYRPSAKKRLGPAPRRKHATLPWLKNLNSSRMPTVQEDCDGNPHVQDEEQLIDNPPVAKPEPLEKSEDFKQLVQSAFFKFLKQINETPSKRKKYMEQGKAGSLKCIVCGSNSDEYVDTERLAMHAFSCEKIGLRSQHLGLHKALCMVMGWRTNEELRSEWHCEVMSGAETSALKEDLIIWPPVVIIHNSTMDNKNPDERVILSAEKLDTKIRAMGFGSILKACNGKPANQSVIVVKFKGTLSGLQEADRLHESYAGRNHGRVEFMQLKSSKNGGGRAFASDEEEDHFLYGHLGIAEDLDKLDFDTKKRCVVRSRKEILSIVDAAPDTETEKSGP